MELPMTAIARRLVVESSRIAMVVAIFTGSAVQASAPPLDAGSTEETVQARFDPASQETHVARRITPSLCLAFSLPQEWDLNTQDGKASLKAVSYDAGLDVSLRSAHELQDLPQPDLARRDAAVLQRDYESIIGRPAQSVSLAFPAPGATRWSATWIDANLPAAASAMTIETFIVPLSNEWVLELSFTDVVSREIYNALAQKVLSGLQVRDGAACGG
jgi:hypothetical protein